MMQVVVLLGLAFLLSACGSSSHSTSSSEVPVGTYRGTVNLTVTVGGASASQSSPIAIVVAPDHTVTVGNFPGSAPLSGKSFTLGVPASVLNTQTLTCQGNFFIAGTFEATTVNGNLSSGGMVCNGFATSVTGNFSATLQAEVPRGSTDPDVIASFRDALMRALGGR